MSSFRVGSKSSQEGSNAAQGTDGEEATEMKTTTTKNRITRPHGLVRRAMTLLLTATAACGAAVPSGDVTATASQALSAYNGFSPNGLNKNGLNKNGLNKNGLNKNGLSNSGLASAGFATWFDADAPTSDMVMSYVAACALPIGQIRTWTSPKTGAQYTWFGVLGLLPGWGAGSAMTTAEEQVLTACLAAHVNQYGHHVWIAVEGRGATGVQIPILPYELTYYPVREACFFGNLVQDEGIFLAFDQPNWDPASSSARGCGVDINKVSVDCSPMVITGEECRDICRADATGVFWESCTWKGKTYKPLTTRLNQGDIYRCGDGVCQFTEHCGTGTTAASCKADCGLCP
jgi:hypothetical protein